VVLAYDDEENLVAWTFRTRWRKCTIWAKANCILCSHTFTEGKYVANALARHELNLVNAHRWFFLPSFGRPYFVRVLLSFQTMYI